MRCVGSRLMPNQGVGAGCSLAMALAEVRAVEHLEGQRLYFQPAPLRLRVDDARSQMEGAEEAVLAELPQPAWNWC